MTFIERVLSEEIANTKAAPANVIPLPVPVTKPMIRSIEDLPPLGDFTGREIRFLHNPLLAEGGITSFTGDSGSGKSTVATYLAGEVSAAGVPVLILDRENSVAIVADRLARLGISDGPLLRIWGGWVPDETPQPGSKIVLDWVKCCDPKPLIIVDSLAAFYNASENDSNEMRRWMQQCRRLADAGATVLILHHTGKSEKSQDYRGSSDFKASLDAGFCVSNSGADGRLETLRLRCFKSRYGFGGEVIYNYADGQFTRNSSTTPAQTASDQLEALLRMHPGIAGSKFELMAADAGLGRNRARNWLDDGVLSGRVVRERFGRNGYRYYLASDPGLELAPDQHLDAEP